MDQLDDIFNMYENTPPEDQKKETNSGQQQQQYKNNYNNDNKKTKKKSYWDNPEVPQRKIDTSKFAPVDPMKYAIAYHPVDGKLPEEAEKKMIQLATILNNNGFELNWNGDNQRSLYQNILGIEDIKINTYLPWGKFNEDAPNIKLKFPSDTAYETAFAYHKNIKNLKNGARAMIAREVNMLLGVDVTDPVKFLLVWSGDGAESTEKMDFKKSGWISFDIRIAEAANIPVFNIQKDDAIKRLNEYIKILKGAE